MFIERKHLENIRKLLQPNRAVIIYGPRRSGKTTLVKNYLESSKEKYLYLTGDDIVTQKILSSQSLQDLKNLVGNNSLLVIDEAQRIENIGINLKLILDNIEGIQVIATGSASFDLANKINEPLTGRKAVLEMLPFAQQELLIIENYSETLANLESRLIYGSYPQIVINNDNQERIRILKEITESYLYKDILELEDIKHANKINHILQNLAYQLGTEVSHDSLGTAVGLNKNTVTRYLDLLEKCYVIFARQGLAKNRNSGITKKKRYYFYDLGIRNTLINNFNPLSIRDGRELGTLWENYVIVERLKKLRNENNHMINSYFWRSYSKQEIDLVEESNNNYSAYEIKWSKNKVKEPSEWRHDFSNSSFKVINKDNYLEFIS